MTEKIIVENLAKKFRLGYKKQSLLASLVNLISGQETKKDFLALKDVSFTTNAGEIIGIIGLNGAGKTTLLRTIAGIYQPDGGNLKINGKVIPLISLDVGLKSRLTMRENIYLGCSFFGLDKSDIKKIVTDIAQLAELENFIETKLYQFSSGMMARLVFAIAINSILQQNPDIILVDEVFAVGDAKFKRKSIAEMKKLKKIKATGLLVTHDLSMIREQCDRVIWLHQGRIVKQGNTEEVVKSYEEFIELNSNLINGKQD